MYFASFHTKFPILTLKESLILDVGPNSYKSIPKGRYVFWESYCTNNKCDCRKVILNVTDKENPGKTLATIDYGWESAKFYGKWLHGDNDTGKEMEGASLEVFGRQQTEHSRDFLELFNDYLKDNKDFVKVFMNHYKLFKDSVSPEELKPLRLIKIGRNEKCPCDSGLKYKRCCGG